MMTTTTPWSDTPPSEPVTQYLWVKGRSCGTIHLRRRYADGSWDQHPSRHWSDEEMATYYQFGPRVLDAEDTIDLTAEVERLRDWKESAMSVLSDWDQVWESLGKPGLLGSSNAKESKKEVARLRERIRWFAKGLLWDRIKHGGSTSAREAWENATDEMMRLAEEAGVWFDDDGNEVPLDKWRARMGGGA